MKKSRVLLIVLCVLFVSNMLMADDQYEYMVVSLGKNFFSEVNAKTYAYFDEIPIASHALLTEMQLDILGRHSWEVIDLLGAIGGDQQITLKREYNEERTKKELKAIKENQTKAQSKKATAPVLEVPKVVKPTLIDLDAQEAAEKEAQRRIQVEQELTQGLKSVLDSHMVEDIRFSWAKGDYTVKYAYLPSIEVNYDVTKNYLLDKNTYRSKQVNAFLVQEKNSLLQILNTLKDGVEKVELNAYIIYENQQFKVGYTSPYYSTYSKIWT